MPKYKKHEESHEKFLKKADDFCMYTLRILKDEEICPKSLRWLGADEIVKITERIHTDLHTANNIKVTNSDEKKQRHSHQIHAYALIATLGEKFVFFSKLYRVRVNKLTRWLDEKAKVQSWLSRWIRSEEERYKDIE